VDLVREGEPSRRRAAPATREGAAHHPSQREAATTAHDS
jgi:hypothetical protein